MRCIAIALAVVAVVGCSTTDTMPDAEPRDGGEVDAFADDAPTDADAAIDPVDPDSFHAALARVRCGIATLCDPKDHGLAYWRWSCHSAYRSRVQLAQTRAVAEGQLAFDVDAARACIAAYRDFTIDRCPRYELDDTLQPDACRAVFTDLVSLGDPCNPAAVGSCEQVDRYCALVSHDDHCTRVCETFRAEGEPCDPARCQAPLECVGGTCTRLGALGEPCAESSDCGRGLVCLDAACTETRHGDVCAGDLDCAFYCVPHGDGSSRCIDPLQTREGDACVYFSSTDTCPDPLVCATSDPAQPAFFGFGSCTLGARAGAACSATRPCSLGHRCVDGTCMRHVGPDDACDETVACPRGFVCDGTCRELPRLGERCDWSGTCFGGMCVDGVCQRAPLGAPCNGARLTPMPVCAEGGYCSGATTGWCDPVVPLGQFCTSQAACGDGECRPVCEGDVCRSQCVPPMCG